jgi:hypothetical protein
MLWLWGLVQSFLGSSPHSAAVSDATRGDAPHAASCWNGRKHPPCNVAESELVAHFGAILRNDLGRTDPLLLSSYEWPVVPLMAT